MSWLSDDGLRVFLVLTVIIGGGAAFLSGRGLARSWKPFWRVFFYTALLAGAIRFFHYALFDGSLLSPYYYLVTYAVLATASCLVWSGRGVCTPCAPCSVYEKYHTMRHRWGDTKVLA